MESNDVQELGRQLMQLRRETFALRTCVVLLLTAVCIGLVAGAAFRDNPKVLQLERIVIVDGEGKERAHFGLIDGELQLTFNGKTGIPRLFAGLGGGGVKDDESPFLNFREAKGMQKLLLGVNPQGEPYVSSRGTKENEEGK